MNVNDIEQLKDRPSFVRFERKAIQDPRALREEGKIRYNDVDYVFVTPPGSKDVHENTFRNWFKQVEAKVRDGRIPPQHRDFYMKKYEAFKAGQEPPLNGTAIKGWGALQPSQQEHLISLNILTVEDLAAITSEAAANIGSGAVKMKQTAINWLKSVSEHGQITAKVTELEAENERQAMRIRDLEAREKQLLAELESKRGAAPVVEREITADDILETPDEFESVPVPQVAEEDKINPDDFRRPNYSDYSDEDLKAAFIKEFDRKPGRMLRENMIDRLTNLHR